MYCWRRPDRISSIQARPCLVVLGVALALLRLPASALSTREADRGLSSDQLQDSPGHLLVIVRGRRLPHLETLPRLCTSIRVFSALFLSHASRRLQHTSCANT